MKGFAGNTSARLPAGPLALLCVAQFVVVLDVTIVATALPAIGADLDFVPAQLGWVITAYTVALAGLLVLGGRVADLAGARAVFVAGLAGFTLASLACALAWAPWVLVVARVAQGVGAAALSPAALALLQQLTPAAAARRRALGWWTAAAAGGGAGGWLLGGVLVQYAGWRWVFAMNLPIGLAALLFVRVLGSGRQAAPPTVRRALDLLGAALATGGVALLTLALAGLAERPGESSGWLAAGLGAALLAGFARVEQRASDPLVPPALLKLPGVLGGNLTAAALTASTSPAMLTVVLYVQDTLHLPPAAGAALFPLFNVAVVAGSALGPWLLNRQPARRVLATGLTAVAGGVAVLLTLTEHGLAAGRLGVSFVLMGLGLGAASVASTAAGTAHVPAGEQGVASGLLNSTAQLGTALGLAVTMPLVATAAPMTGYRLAFTVALVVALAGAAAGLTVRDGPTGATSRRAAPAADP